MLLYPLAFLLARKYTGQSSRNVELYFELQQQGTGHRALKLLLVTLQETFVG